MAARKFRVYCAGPLFNAKEREQMQELADRLKEADFDTFLPQRDGLELTSVVEALVEKGRMDAKRATDLVSKAIFALDVYQVVRECDAIIVNLNGRVPDEGAVSEAAIAWCFGKALAAFKADSRSVFLGQDNPLVTGLFDFRIHDTCEGAVAQIKRALHEMSDGEERSQHRSEQIDQYVRLGSRIWQAAAAEDRVSGIADVLFAEMAGLDAVGTCQRAGSIL